MFVWSFFNRAISCSWAWWKSMVYYLFNTATVLTEQWGFFLSCCHFPPPPAPTSTKFQNPFWIGWGGKIWGNNIPCLPGSVQAQIRDEGSDPSHLCHRHSLLLCQDGLPGGVQARVGERGGAALRMVTFIQPFWVKGTQRERERKGSGWSLCWVCSSSMRVGALEAWAGSGRKKREKEGLPWRSSG